MKISELEKLLSDEGLSAFKRFAYELTTLYETAIVLDSCQLETGINPGKYEMLAAYGCNELFTISKPEDIDQIKGKWAFGILSYDLKNKIESLSSNNDQFIEGQESLLFEPQLIIALDRDHELKILKGELPTKWPEYRLGQISNLSRANAISKEDYIPKIEQIKELILSGDVYELNYCVQHRYHYDQFDPLAFHLKLIERSAVPMASFLKHNGMYICGASMERFMMRIEDQLMSQPIKGTIKKSSDAKEDEALKAALYHSEKDRAENVMIVDLVRNDLSKVCEAGSVKVDELFGIYSYLQVHQMISTITGKLMSCSLSDIVKASFPMGSMTGAPKVSAMQHIEELEDFKRGWYSGAIGYFQPNGDFDLNVVIRSLICDSTNNKLAYSAGGAITIDSVPESEWLECLLKTKAIEEILIH